MARLDPTIKTVKKLFALSGNICAFPSCQTKMVDENGNVLGQICHIEAAETNGERYNTNQNDEERRSFDNLILLCANDHVVTNDVTTYTVPVLQKMKKDHESGHQNNKYSVSDISIAKAIIQYQTFNTQNNFNTGSGIQINNQVEKIVQKYYVNKNDEEQELSIVEEIFVHVNAKISEGVGKDYKPDPSINLIEKIKLNFKSVEAREEVNTYFRSAFLKIDLIDKRFKILDPEQQKDIHAHLLKEYHLLKRDKGSNIEILTALFNQFVPNGKAGNSRYESLSIAFVLYFFDDCTIFEKTETEKQEQTKLQLDF